MKEKIEEIINKYQIHTSIGIKETIDVCDEWDMKTMGVAINELSTLIQEERKEAKEEAFGEFMKMVKIDPDSCFYRFKVPEQMAISTYINEIFEKVGNYLQTLKDKDENR